jgi:predicted nucleotidyltransferase
MLLEKNKEAIQEQFDIKSLGIFGSYAKGHSSKKSDIDMLVEFSKTPTMFKFIQLERKLSQILGIKVDLVTRKALKPLIKEHILQETIFL